MTRTGESALYFKIRSETFREQLFPQHMWGTATHSRFNIQHSLIMTSLLRYKSLEQVWQNCLNGTFNNWLHVCVQTYLCTSGQGAWRVTSFLFEPTAKNTKHSNCKIQPCDKLWYKNIMRSYSTSGWQRGTHLEAGLCDPPRCVEGCCWAPLPLGSGSARGSQMEGCYCPRRRACSHCHYTAGPETSPPPLNSPSPHWAPPASGWTWGAQTHFLSVFTFSLHFLFFLSIFTGSFLHLAFGKSTSHFTFAYRPSVGWLNWQAS